MLLGLIYLEIQSDILIDSFPRFKRPNHVSSPRRRDSGRSGISVNKALYSLLVRISLSRHILRIFSLFTAAGVRAVRAFERVSFILTISAPSNRLISIISGFTDSSNKLMEGSDSSDFLLSLRMTSSKTALSWDASATSADSNPSKFSPLRMGRIIWKRGLFSNHLPGRRSI